MELVKGVPITEYCDQHQLTPRERLERLAKTLLDQGDYAEAAKMAQKLPSALPNHGQGYNKAVPFLIRCAKLAEKDSRLSESDGKAAVQAYFDSAREFQRQLTNGFPNDPEALNNCAWQMAAGPEPRLRDVAQAVDLAKTAVDLAPKNGQFWNTSGAAHYRTGDWKDAVDALNKSMELRQGGDAFDWFFLAMAEWHLGNKVESRQWYDKALEWTHKNAATNEELQRFQSEAAELLGVAPPTRGAG
jgi:Flp pilus assembly protein TadD